MSNHQSLEVPKAMHKSGKRATALLLTTLLALSGSEGRTDSNEVASAPECSLSLAGPESGNNNLIPNASFEDANDGPKDWSTSSWGENSAKFTYSDHGHTGLHAGFVEMTDYQDGDAKWVFDPVEIEMGQPYTFSIYYKSDVDPKAVVAYTMKDGSIKFAEMSTPLSNTVEACWQRYKAELLPPPGAEKVSVLFLLRSNGRLLIDDASITKYEQPIGFNEGIVSITFDDGLEGTYDNGLPLLKEYGLSSTQYIIPGHLGTPGYMTESEVKTLAEAGNEIGSHTMYHATLTEVDVERVDDELTNSRNALARLGVGAIRNFAAPHGAINGTVTDEIDRFYGSNRGVSKGYNDRYNFNPSDILVHDVNKTTTSEQVRSWVQIAREKKLWLVLVYHDITESVPPDVYGVSKANLDEHLGIIKSSGLGVLTIQQALEQLKPQVGGDRLHN